MKNNKKSQAHVEMIISFVLFIGAIVFIFIFLNPVAQPKLTTSMMNEIKKTVIQNMSSNIGKLSIVTNETGVGECYNFNPADYSNDNYLEIQDDPIYLRKYTIIFSDIFDTSYAPKKNNDCDPENYTIGTYTEESIINYDKISETKVSYESDYNSLKKSSGINYDFSFNFRNLNRVEISELSVSKNIPLGTERDSKDILVRVIDDSGNIQELILNIRAW